MIKLQHPGSISMLPLLVGAVSLPAHAQVLAVATSGALAQAATPIASAKTPAIDPAIDLAPGAASAAESPGTGAWRSVLARRHQALQLSRREQWVAAASMWREVLFELRQIERLEPQRAPFMTQAEALKQEAEREMKSAQSHLDAFWRVRDMVTLGADSRNAPNLAARPETSLDSTLESGAATELAEAKRAEPQKAPTVSSSALVRQPSLPRPSPQLARARWAPAWVGRVTAPPRSRPAARVAVKATRLSKPSGQRASLRWAQAQWWAQPMVLVGSDSRNATPSYVEMGGAPLSAPRLVLAPGESLRSAALLKAPVAPEPIAEPSRGNAAPVRVQQLWTMQVRLPSAAEAAQAAARPLGF